MRRKLQKQRLVALFDPAPRLGKYLTFRYPENYTNCMAIELHSVSEKDISRLAEIFYQCLKNDYREVLPPEVLEPFSETDSLELWQKSYKSQSHLQFIGAWGNGSLLGFAKFGGDPEGSEDGYLASLYVDPGYSGQGIGRMLLTHVLQELTAYPKTKLWVFEKNPRAIALYESLGFLRSGRTRTEAEWQALQCELVLDNS